MAGVIVWQWAQVAWVGGLWALYLGLLPALAQMGFAPLLIDDITQRIGSLWINFAAVCLGLQGLVLLHSLGWRQACLDRRGHLLLLGGLACAGYFVLPGLLPEALRWGLFCYLILGVIGLALVVQPLPGRARKLRP